MNARLTAFSLAMAGVLVLGWHFSSDLADLSDEAAASSAAPFPPSAKQNVRTHQATGNPASMFARASAASASPFAATPQAQFNVTAQDGNQPRKQFEQLLQDYHFGAHSPDDKVQIKETLSDLKRDPLARAFIIETFFSPDKPQLAESLYGLIRDADLKDVGLLESLIQRDGTRSTASSKARIVDLIADLSTKKDVPYSAAIDAYLAQAAQSTDPNLRHTAASQRMWYLAQHQPNNLAVLAQNLLDTASTVREEAYSLIESRLASQTPTAQANLAPVLNTALSANRLGASLEEKTRVSALLQTLTASSAPL